MSDAFEDAIERNADIILITLFAIVDLSLTYHVIDWVTTLETVSVVNQSNAILIDPKRLFINYQYLNIGIVFKSIILYSLAFFAKARLDRSGDADEPPRDAG